VALQTARSATTTCSLLSLAVAALLSSGCCQYFGIGCTGGGDVNFHVSNSANGGISVYAIFSDNSYVRVGDVAPQTSDDFVQQVKELTFTVAVQYSADGSDLGEKQVTVSDPSNQEVDVSVVDLGDGFQAFISVNPQSGGREAAPSSDCCSGSVKSAVNGASRAGRKLIGR